VIVIRLAGFPLQCSALLLTCGLEMLGLILGQNTILIDVFHGFPHFLHVNVEVVLQIMPLSSASITIHHSQIILLFIAL
jgi:hypothetical protein